MYKFPNKVLFSEHISGSKHSIEILFLRQNYILRLSWQLGFKTAHLFANLRSMSFGERLSSYYACA